ncbi:carbohydrate porin [Vibrio sp. RE86]|uniref:carbohydrate porin n=1 Tax=Vibrio sp. RE86 TaxID=2607605 RepID=UPI00149396C2|nr:carbohydrate porin [Vibrio sp. RE86]
MKKVSVIAAAVATALMAGSAIAAEASLEERVAQLEAQLAETTAVAEEAQATASEADSGFEFHGYARQGVVYNGDGSRLDKGGFHDQGAFFHPAAPYLHNYRLGNEPHNYLEANLSKKWTTESGTWAKFYTTLATHQYYADSAFSEGNGGDDNDLSFRQVYAEMGNLDFLPQGATMWAGKRYYGRADIYQSDFLYRIYDGTGIGVQNIAVGEQSLDIAYITADRGSWTPQDADGIDELQHNLNVAYKGVKGLGGSFDFEMNLAYAGNRADNTGTIDGVAVDTDKPEFGYNFAVTYGRGDFFGFADGWSKVAVMAGGGLGASHQSNTLFINNEDAFGARVAAFGVWDISDDWDMMAEFVYDRNKDGEYLTDDSVNGYTGGTQDIEYYTVGVMPVYKVTQNFSIQSQFSYEYGSSDFEGSKDYKIWHGGSAYLDGSSMYKATIAPTVTLDSGNFWAKPTFRAFATYATWDDEIGATGQGVGTNGSATDNDYEITYGVQMEVWF